MAIPLEGAPHSPITVLYVDDEPGLRSLALEELRQSGFRALTAADGIEALEVLQENPDIQVLIADIRMPRMGGRELVINAQARNPKLKAALVTAFSDDAVQFLDFVECPILLKPFEIERLPNLALDTWGQPDA